MDALTLFVKDHYQLRHHTEEYKIFDENRKFLKEHFKKMLWRPDIIYEKKKKIMDNALKKLLTKNDITEWRMIMKQMQIFYKAATAKYVFVYYILCTYIVCVMWYFC